MKFQDLRLSEPLLRAIGEKGYTDPTPIQQQAIPPVLEGRDLQGLRPDRNGQNRSFHAADAPTFSRRTGPQGTPPDPRPGAHPDARTGHPDRRVLCRDYARYTPIRHCVIFGGVNQRPQVDALQKGVDLLVATPGRLLDLIGQGYVTLDTIRFFVLDEADRMLDMGFIHDIRRILPLLPERRQTLFFSATMPESIAALAAKILRNPVLVTVTPPASVVETIAQTVHFAEKAEKNQPLIDLLSASDAQQVLVFSRTKHGADKLAKILNRAGIRSCAIHGNKSQNARVKAMNDFKSGECRVMIATDIAARGIDIDQLPLVINYELPEVAETYVHRIGRTGRAGHEGAAWSFCSEDEFEYLCDIQKLTGLTIPTEGPVPEYALRKAAPARKPAQKAAQRPARTQEPKPARNAGAKSAQRPARDADAGQRPARGRPATRSRRPPAMPRRRRSLRKIRRSPRPGRLPARRARVADGARVPHRERPSSRPEKPPPAPPTRRAGKPRSKAPATPRKPPGTNPPPPQRRKTPPTRLRPLRQSRPAAANAEGRGTPPGPRRLPPPSPRRRQRPRPRRKNGGKGGCKRISRNKVGKNALNHYFCTISSYEKVFSDMHFYKRWNNITGWAVFAVAAMVYLMTMEPVSSLWDCSEFIATSYKLEVGHPPGAPLFMMLARLATLFAFGNPDYVGIAVNAMNSLASAFCILFLFWTITHLARRLVTRDGAQLTAANTWAVLGAGAVGALAYTFTDTFWFSAVEGEVYALSSMFTALVVWLMLKWEEQADEPHSSRWIVLIAYLMGLSIGVHILNLLCIPALVFIYYFRKTATVTWRGIALSTLVSGAMIVFVNNIIIPYTVWIGAQIDTLFVNTFGLPVNSGITLFALALIIGLGWAAWAAHKRGRVLLNIILLSTTMILVGYSSYASVTIRAAANPPMNSNNPNNPHALLSLLNRDQYGDRPLLYGAQYSAPPRA